MIALVCLILALSGSDTCARTEPHPGHIITFEAQAFAAGQVWQGVDAYCVIRAPAATDKPVYISARTRMVGIRKPDGSRTWVEWTDHTLDGFKVRVPVCTGAGIEWFDGWQAEDGRVLINGSLVEPYQGKLDLHTREGFPWTWIGSK